MSDQGAAAFSAERPFVGLRSYTYADHAHFFGRDDQIFSLYRLLDHSSFIAVIGSSGSGKSSLVCAGLLPLLQEESEGTGGHEWRWIQMHPGNAPLANLAEALARNSPAADDGVAADRLERIAYGLRRSRFGLNDALAATSIPPGASVLLVVDQFEELFRYAGHARAPGAADARLREEAAHFVQLLLEASRSRRVHVLITMRSDFIGDCARFHGLPEAVSATQFLVPSLARDQLEEVIRKPIEKAQASIESDLVERLLNEAGGEFDQLPVLQHCLMRLWERAGRSLPQPEARRHLTAEHYRDIKGFAGALSEHAEEILRGLPGMERVVEQVFRGLAETDKEGRVTRRAIEYEQLQRETGESDRDVRQVVDRFRADDCSFLLPSRSDKPALAADTLIDVGHEALLRRWDRVNAETATGRKGWLRDEEEDGQHYRVLQFMATRGTLVPFQEVEARERWWNERNRTEAWAARYGGHFRQIEQLLEASRAALEAHRAEEQRAAQEEERRKELLKQQEIEAGRQAELLKRQQIEAEKHREVLRRQEIEAEKQAEVLKRQEVEIAAARDRERGVRRMGYVLAALVAVTLAFLFTALWLVGRAVDQRKEADKQRVVAQQQRDLANTSMAVSLQFVSSLLKQISDQTQDGSVSTATATQLLATAEKVFESVPDTEQTRATRAQLQLGFVDVYLELQNFQQARKYAEQAKAYAETLARTNPGNAEWQFLLYGAAFRLGDRLVFVETPRALQEYELAYRIVRELADKEPQVGRWQDAMAFVLVKIGDIKLVQQDQKAALAAYRLSLDIAANVAGSKAATEDSPRNVANAHIRIGDLYARQKQWTAARTEFQAGLKIREQLAQEHPNNISLSNLTVAYNRIGLVFRESKQFDEALEQYRKAFEVRWRIANSDPNNNAWQSALAFQHIYIADVLAMKGQIDDALVEYRRALSIREVLVGKDPSNVTWARNLADLQEIIARLFVAQRGRDALQHFDVALRIRAELAKRFADTAARQADLYRLLMEVGAFLLTLDEPAAARGRFEAALKVADDYLARHADSKVWQRNRAAAAQRITASSIAPQ